MVASFGPFAPKPKGPSRSPVSVAADPRPHAPRAGWLMETMYQLFMKSFSRNIVETLFVLAHAGWASAGEPAGPLRTHGRPGSRAASDRSAPRIRADAGGVRGVTTGSLGQGRRSAMSIITILIIIILVLLAIYLVRRVV